MSDSAGELVERMRRAGAGSKGVSAGQEQPKADPSQLDELIASLDSQDIPGNTATPQTGKRAGEGGGHAKSESVKFTIYLRPDQIKWLRRQKVEEDTSIYNLAQQAMV